MQNIIISSRKINLALLILLAVSAVVRAFIAGFIELGNDEVYYWTYAKFPALSHFDHPPMVGLVIQAFSLNLWFDNEFFIRLGSVILGTASTWLIFLIGRLIKNPLTGLYAALLFTASFYGFVLSGTFILPDTPQVFFWLLSLYFLLKALSDESLSGKSKNLMLYAGVAVGLAFLSKYHSVFLLLGTFLYMLFYNRKWFLVKETYFSFFIFLLLTLPVVFWNIENQFISFTFHENRVGITESGLQLQYFLTEVAGQFFYNNPVNVVIIIAALVALIRKRSFLDVAYVRLLLLISLPLILLFLGFSLFRSTLPHWTGPGYLGLILIASAFLSEPRNDFRNPRLIPLPVATSLGFILLVIIMAVGQIRYGWVPLQRWGMEDVTHDLVCWRQLGDKFAPVSRKRESEGLISKDAPILTFRWFPAANFDYYVGRKINKPAYALGTLERIHKYHWINKIRGPLKKGSDAWFISLSDDYEDPNVLYGNLFMSIVPDDTLVLTRRNEIVRKAFLYRMISLKEEMDF
ncbi:MAG: glycosyltransferase family 39 protein [Bacteroidetes bacterium]|nr:glycosyltransferase family 39 protein [Bacteroidota bacterium]